MLVFIMKICFIDSALQLIFSSFEFIHERDWWWCDSNSKVAWISRRSRCTSSALVGDPSHLLHSYLYLVAQSRISPCHPPLWCCPVILFNSDNGIDGWGNTCSNCIYIEPEISGKLFMHSALLRPSFSSTFDTNEQTNSQPVLLCKNTEAW